ncbi:MAG: ABC transporter ATP-binding protein [Actinobacteria bacterium]|nr:ABC transporter ATP-binding protein [Actinomycetota bacterium]
MPEATQADRRGGALTIEGVTQRFGTTDVLRGIDLDIAAGEFLGMLGPSGCGKSTLLRIIGGLDSPSGGRVVLDGTDITATPAERRPINTVFQRPTLFPHLDVFENVAFGLRVEGTSRGDIPSRVGEALDLVRLGHLARRRADELSGGQMQRVALARALVKRPRVLLLDEPLSALDLKIRLELEAELRRIHHETGATFIYVTHDQGEALGMSDRVAVFSEGEIAQLGTPLDVYTAPRTSYVARFVGDANVIPVEVLAVASTTARLRLAGTELEAPCPGGLATGPAQLVVRAESVALSDAPGGLRGRVIDQAFRGTRSSYLLDVEGVERPLRAEVPSTAFGGDGVAVGTDIGLAWAPATARLIAADPVASAPELEAAA